MDYFDAVIRFAATGQLIIVALLALLDRNRTLASVLLGVCAICVAGILLNSSPFPIPIEWRWVLRILETPNTALIWLLGLAIFRDDFRIQTGHWIVVGLVCVQGVTIRFDVFDALLPFYDERLLATYAVYFAMVAHLVWRVVTDAAGDMLTRRRQARLLALIGFAVVSVAVAVFELTLPHAVQSLLRAMITLTLTTALVVWLMRFDASQLGFTSRSDVPDQSLSVAEPMSPLALKLRQVIEEDRAYLEPSLTVKALAERVGFAEHKVRAHINRETGFRNFASFINHHRITAAKQMLADPDNARSGILGIALDVGFASLTTFNRAFKAIEGETPSEFRARALGEVPSEA